MRISDWSSDVCSSDLQSPESVLEHDRHFVGETLDQALRDVDAGRLGLEGDVEMMLARRRAAVFGDRAEHPADDRTERLLDDLVIGRSEEHTSELQSLMRISYAVFCLKKKTK